MNKTYPEYKGSGIEWLGNLPAHWRLPKLEWITTKIGSGSTPRGGSKVYQKEGVIFLRSQNIQFDGLDLNDVAYISEDIHGDMERSVVEPGDVLLNITGASIGRCTSVPRSFGAANVNQHVCIVRPVDSVVPEYLEMVLASKVGQYQVFSLQDGSSREGLNYAQLGSFAIPLPSLVEQRILADYLDRKTEQIDTLIARKERLIYLLQEQRTAIINRAVTKGLDPDAPMKDSGIEWLGEMPAHWETGKLRHVAQFYGGGTPSKSNEEYWEGEIPWVSPKDMKINWISDSEDHITQQAISDSTTRLIDEGAVLIVVRSGILRHSLPVAINTRPVTINQDMKAIVPNAGLLPGYLRFYIIGNEANLLQAWRKQGATVQSIEQQFLAEHPMSLPPIEEQSKIVEFLDGKMQQVEKVITDQQRLISLLQELRTSLISEVVTGKIDVREEAEVESPGLETEAVAA